MWPIRSHILNPMTEEDRDHKGREIICNGTLEESFKKIKCMVSTETLLGYTDCTIPFTVHTNTSDKQFCAIISKNNRSITLFSRRLSKAQRNYTTNEKELLTIA